VFLIFGLSVFFRTVREGTFYCPRDGGDRAYRLRSGRRFFTLFFLPVIPLNSVGEVVECRSCKTRYSTDVLQAPTAREMASALPAGMRAAAALVLRAGGGTHPAARARAAEAVQGYGEHGYGDQAVEADLRLDGADLEQRISVAGAQLAPEAKEWFLAQAARIGLADGPLADAERQALNRIADLLGMSRAHALGVIITTEGAAR
jgi:tellurite resistance protein